MYGGSGISPTSRSASSSGPAAIGRTSMRPPSSRSPISISSPPPATRRIPGVSLRSRPGERLPRAVAARLDQQHLRHAAGRPPGVHAHRQHAGGVDDHDVVVAQLVRAGRGSAGGGSSPEPGRTPAAARHPAARPEPGRSGRRGGRSPADRCAPRRTVRSPPRMGGGGTDEELVRRAQRGDRAAFDELVVRHRDRVYAVALRLTRNPADAEDALQDTFLNAYRALGRFGGRARVSTWLYRIAANASYDVINRRRGRDQPIDDGAHEPVAPGDPYVAGRAAPGAGAGARRAAGRVPRGRRAVRHRRARRRRGGGAPRRSGWYGQVPGVPGPRAARRRAAGTRCPRSRRNPSNERQPRHARARRAVGG